MSIHTRFTHNAPPDAPRVVTFGNQPAPTHLSHVREKAMYAFGECGIGDIAVMQPAAHAASPGFQRIDFARWDTETAADGAWSARANPKTVLALTTADCPAVVAWWESIQRVCVVHAGRSALTPYNNQTILTRAMEEALRCTPDTDASNVWFAVTPGISVQEFRHDFHDDARTLVDPFRELHQQFPHYGIISDDGADRLDLRAVIRAQLEQWYGVPTDNIAINTTCTYTDPRFASHRAKDTGRTNLTMVLV